MNNLSAQIMNLRCDTTGMDDRHALACKIGYRDARHAAAELVCELEQQRDELLAALKEYIAAADSSMCADDESDDVAKMLRFGDADKAARAAITKAEAA